MDKTHFRAWCLYCMNFRLLALLLSLATSVSVSASDYRHSVGVGVLEVMNVKISARATPLAEPSLAPRTNREYVNGFNRVDSSGNLGEGAPGLPSRTSNFGFTSNSQVDLARGTLSLTAVSPSDTDYVQRSSEHGDPGFEFVYRVVRDRPGAARLGLEMRAGYLDLDYDSSDTFTSSARVITDAYPLGGVVPQPAPYTGSFTVQPGTQRIGDTPTRSVATSAATVAGRREYSARGWLLRFGGVWEAVSTERVTLQFHGGPALLRLKGSFRYDERWTATGLPALAQAGEGSKSEWLLGGYAGATADVKLSDRWSIVGSADFLHADTLKVSSTAGSARFDFSRGWLVSLGAAYRF